MRFFRREEPPVPEPAREPTAYERQMARQARYDALCHAIFVKGAHFRRDFGHWVRLRLPDGTYLQLDSYGRNLMRKEGSGEYPGGNEGYYGGFAGKDIAYIGSHFGEPASVKPDDAALAALEAAVAAAPDQVDEGDPRVYTRHS